MEKTEFMGAQHGPRLAVPGAAGRGEGKVRAATTVSGPRMAGRWWEEGACGLAAGSRGSGGRAGGQGWGRGLLKAGLGRFCADTLRNV